MQMVELPVTERAHMVVGVGQAITERENKIKRHTHVTNWAITFHKIITVQLHEIAQLLLMINYNHNKL